MRAFFVVLLVFAFLAPLGGAELMIATGSPEWRQASVGRPWALRLEAAGAVGAVEWMVAEGMLPPGVHLVEASLVMLGAAPGAVLYGAPAEPGSYWVLLKAKDGEGRWAESWMEIRVSLLSLKETSATATAGERFEWRAEPVEGVAPFEVKLGEAAYLPLGLVISPGGAIYGEARVAGRYEIPVEVRDAGGNTLKTTMSLGVYGAETTLPAVAVRLRREGCRLTADWLPVPEGIEVKLFGGEEDVPLEIEVTNRESGERVMGWYPAPGPCPSDPQT